MEKEQSYSQSAEDQEFRRLCSDRTLQAQKEGFFNDFLASVADKVTTQELEGFCNQQNDQDRIIYCWSLLVSHQVMPPIRPVFRPKSSEESVIRRQKGNEAFQNKDYKTSLSFYNQSVIFAPCGNFSNQLIEL